MPNYLKEAFKELELLNEETFSFDKDGAAELKKFYDGDTTDDYESIIDPEAETKDELEDSYEGKVIIACKICHGMQYKDPQDIVIDEESDYVNVGEECPACSAVDGYKIVGQVAPYCAECDEMDESASKLKESLWNFNITRMPKIAASKLDKIDSSGLWDDFLDEMDDNTESITVHTDEYRIVKGTSDEVIAHDKKIMWDLINKYYDKALKKSKGESYNESLDEKRKDSLIIESLKSAPKRHFKESLNEGKNKYLSILRNELGLTGAKSMDNKDYRYYMFSVPKDKRNDKLLKDIEDKIPGSKAFYDERGALKVRIGKDKLKEALNEESLNEEKLTTLFDVVGGMLDGTMDRITINKKTGKKQAVGTKTPYEASKDIGVDDDGYFVWVADEAGAKYAQEVADKFGLKTKLDAPTKYISARNNRKFHIYIPRDRFDEPVKQVVEESLSEGIVDESGSNPRAVWVDAVRNELGKPAYTDSYPKRSIYRLKYVFDLEDKYEAEAFAEKARKLDHVKRVIGPKETSMWRGGPDVFMVNVMVDYPPIEQAVEESCGKLEESHDKAYIMSQILLKLEDEGYDVRSHKKDAIAYAESAADLIMIAPDGYTVDKWFEDTKMNYPEDLLRFKKFSDLKESVENITVETDSDTIKVEPSEDGKVEVKTEPKQKDEKNDEEMIVPVSSETKDEIDVNDANFDETDVDIDIDSIDDEGFDVLGESYLKKVYENVKSFKTSSSSIKDGKLMVEGIISFNSGKKAKTSFVFESISKTKRGKIKFLGENLNFSKSKSAFTLIAKPEGKKAVCESLTYNYVAKDSKSNKKLPVYGKVSK